MAHSSVAIAPSGSTFDYVLAKIPTNSGITVELGSKFDRLPVRFFKKDKQHEWMREVACSSQCNGFAGGLRDVIDPISCAGAV